MRLETLQTLKQAARRRPHGTRARYVAGCRCTDCRKANSRYSSAQAIAVREGRGNPIVAAAAAREHILALGRYNVGYKSVAAAASVPSSIVAGIRSGKRLKARRQTIERILAVSSAARADHALIPHGKRLWRLISQLTAEGYSKAALARALNYRAKTLQFGKKWVTVRSLHKVTVLHRQLMEGTAPAALRAKMNDSARREGACPASWHAPAENARQGRFDQA